MEKPKTKLKHPDCKISEAFLQFAEPLCDAPGPGLSEEELANPLKIAWTVWNAVVYADVAGNNQILASVLTSMKNDPLLRAFFEMLIDRKRTLFGNDDRLIGEYKVFRKDGELRVRAEARDPLS